MRKSKNKWKKKLHTWHWISSAISLICMIIFSITGITLNHSNYFESKAQETRLTKVLPKNILDSLNNIQVTDRLHIPIELNNWIENNIEEKIDIQKYNYDWNDYEIYFQNPIPGGDKWLSIDLENGSLEYMHTNRGVVAWLNDLHKGRNTGQVWIWFIDIFSIATLIFCITGLILLQIHSKNRPSTWYITGLGLIIPAILLNFI